MEKSVLSIQDLIIINEGMLGRGMPVVEDGVGYNKADYGACANYFYGMSDAQVADLAKRLVKYSNTQLHLDKQMMKDTAEYYKSLVKDDFDRTDGVSVNITENGTLISFRYNETFINIIKAQPRRQYDGDNKQWIVPNADALITLEKLADAGADVKNAMEYVGNHELCKIEKTKKVEVLSKTDGEWTLLKFDYNERILDAIRKVERADRQWNSKYKYWAVKNNHMNSILDSIEEIAVINVM